MVVFYIILLAIVQGITEFLPVSSFGHLAVVRHLLAMDGNTGILLEAMLHLGTLAAIFFLWKKDLRKIGVEILGMIMDLIGNLNLFIHNKRTGANLHYAKIVHGTYRKLAALMVVSTIPTVLLGLFSRDLVEMTGKSVLMSGIGCLLTGIILLVTDFGKAGGDKAPRDITYDCAMWIGICQGLAIFPGISRSALTICAALFLGFSRKFAVRYSYILSIPAIVGAFLMEVKQFGSSDMTIGLGFSFVFGAIVAGLVGCLLIRVTIRLTENSKLRYFAYYCFIIGILALAVNYM